MIREYLKKLVTGIKCIFISHRISEQEVSRFRENGNKPMDSYCETCNHALLVEVHPIATNSLSLVEI